MRVLQLIDSLDVGGAETIAVNYANALSEKIAFSGLVATRKTGVLQKNILPKVFFDCIEKKKSLDIKAIFRLQKIVDNQNIEIIHAHGTSYFTAFLLKIIRPKLKIVWHEHYGARANQLKKDNLILWLCSLFFHQIFVVNLELKTWAQHNLLTKNVDYIANFAVFSNNEQKTALSGVAGKRIVCLANLKNPKNHSGLLKAFNALKIQSNDFNWSLHFIGTDFNDDYSATLRTYITEKELGAHVFIYGLQTDIKHILLQAEFGVLASMHEGFPVALLEYYLAEIPVVSTNAGYCDSIVEDTITGLLFDPNDQTHIEKQLKRMISDDDLRKKMVSAIKRQSGNGFSKEKVIALLISKYSRL